MSFTPLHPARLTYAANGTPFSAVFDDIYYSADGGPGQAQHVFLNGNDLPQNWADKRQFVILENGFGSGLNFLATWAAWRADPARPHTLHYLATELHPFQVDDLAKLHRHWPQFEFLAEALRNAWPLLFTGFHRLEFAAGRVVLTLMLGDAEVNLRKLRAEVDAFYLDGFDPNKNPRMWSPSLFKRLSQLAAPEATFATWCVAGQARRALSSAGFAPEKRPGFGSKRQMLAGKLVTRRNLPHPVQPPTRPHAVVIGAGLAGCAIAERLSARGWQVDLLDRHAAPAQEASGNLAGIARPLLSRDDNLASRINRACFLHLDRSLHRLDQAGFPPRRKLNGILQMAHDAEHEEQMRDWLLASGFPDSFARFVERDEASKTLHANTAQGGWLFPAGGWANPSSLCRAWLAAGGAGIRFQGEVEVARLLRVNGVWQVIDSAGKIRSTAATLVMATGTQTLAQTAGLPILPVRGQVSHLPADTLPKLAHAVCREGYLTPAVDGVHCLGASYSKDDIAGIRIEEHAENLHRLAAMLPGTETHFVAEQLHGRVGFRATTPDHLPLVGALPDLTAHPPADMRLRTFPRQSGLFGLLGLGSRGLVWAALLAETLASQINGEPLPLSGDQIDALDPARFALRAHRHRPL